MTSTLDERASPREAPTGTRTTGAGRPVPDNAEDPAVVRRQGPRERSQAAELLAEPVEEDDEDVDEDVDEEDAEEEEDDDGADDDFASDDDELDADGFDAGLLLDEEPRESLR
jgi:hypothetical protein